MESVRVLVWGIIHNTGDFYIFSAERDTSDPIGGRKITCKGRLFGIQGIAAGVPIELFGKWIYHPKFGRQFDFNGWAPWAESVVGVENFFRCCLRVLDEFQLACLIDTFGVDTFKVLSDNPNRLLGVPGYTEDLVQSLSLAWTEALVSSDLSEFLSDHDITSEQMQALFTAFGVESRRVIAENPYRLLEVEGFTFDKADSVAQANGIELDDPRRFEGAVLWVLREASKSGNLCVRRGDLAPQLLDLIRTTDVYPFEGLNLGQELVKATARLEEREGVRIDPEVGVYLPNLYEFERKAAQYLVKFITPLTIDVDLVKFLENYENIRQIKLSDAQRDAVEKLINNRVLVLTGGPGTGKTTITRTFVEMFERTGITYALMAPTGIAAKRMASVTGRSAATIHRTFRYNGDTWGYNAWNKYPIGAVIIDECCLPYRQFIDLADGSRRYIGTIVNQRQPVEVLSYNTSTGCVEPRRVVNWFKYPHSEEDQLFKVKLSSSDSRSRQRVLRCTGKHKVYVSPSSQKMVSNLMEGDQVLIKGLFFNKEQRSFALGSLLGDASIGGTPSGRRLRFVHCQEQESYLRFKSDLFQCSEPYTARGGYKPDKFTWCCTSPIIEDLEEDYRLLYPNDEKVPSRKWLDQLDAISLAAWYMDDGSLSLPDGSSAVILHTEGFNKASCYILAKWLFEKWGFEAGVYSNGKRGHFFLRLTCASSCAFWKLIAPWVHPSMAYKIPRGVLIGHSLGQLSSNFVEVSGYSVRSISKYTPKENSRKSVYDIEVEGNHNYFSNGVLVSNSMVDQELFFRTLDALEEGTILVLVGDDAQLPSVGPGNVLRELVRCPSIPTVRLTQIFRQAQKSEIILNSHRINHGDSIKPGDDSSDFRFVSILDDTKILELIVQMAKKLKSRDENFQVLSPKHEGVVGVINLNDKLREVLNPPAPGKKELTIGTLRFREGDRLMVIKNDYSLGIYNGDMGKLITIRSETLTVRIHGIGEGGIDVHVEVPRKEILQKLRLAYAITVHKSQGSEFDTVILPMVRNHGRMLQRNLFYTAVTRAKKKVWLLGDRGSIQKAINNDHVIHRNTGFGKSILELMQGAT